MNRDELKSTFRNASQRFLELNSEAHFPVDAAGPVAKLERDLGDAPLDTQKVQRRIGRRVLIRITSARSRLLDQDNIAVKYLVDLLRYAGIISGDSPGEAQIEITQFKTQKGEPEQTTVEVFEI